MRTRRQWHICLRCEARWLGRNSFKGDSGLPKRCANCGSPLWNTPRKKNGYGCFSSNKKLRKLLITAGFCFAAVITGCATAPAPKPAAMSKTAQRIAQAPAPGFDLPAIQYPPDMTNYVWSVQWSPDLIHWRDLATNLTGLPGAPMEIKENGAPAAFFRLKGNR